MIGDDRDGWKNWLPPGCYLGSPIPLPKAAK
jgi:hypothetical protein